MRTYSSSIVIAAVVAGGWLQAGIRAEGAETPVLRMSHRRAGLADSPAPEKVRLEQATFGLGCYSCAEAIFERLKGVTVRGRWLQRWKFEESDR